MRGEITPGLAGHSNNFILYPQKKTGLLKHIKNEDEMICSALLKDPSGCWVESKLKRVSENYDNNHAKG